MNAVLSRFGFPTHPVQAYRYFVGSGMDCLARVVLPEGHLDEQTIDKCMEAVRQEYSKRWAENTRVYPGINELLSAMEKLGLSKAVLSNKPDEFVRLTVEFFLSDFSFSIIRGHQPATPKKPDPTTALQIAQQLRIPPQQFLYLGDTDTDMQTANAAGMYAVGVLWGFRDAQELHKSGAKTLVEKPSDVLKLLDDSR